MCRNITVLRSLEPPATPDEIEDAARQYIRKIAGLQSPSQLDRDDVVAAITGVAQLTAQLLDSLPPRRRAPQGPPRRRIAARSVAPGGEEQ
jgi:hypothetical protein